MVISITDGHLMTNIDGTETEVNSSNIGVKCCVYK